MKYIFKLIKQKESFVLGLSGVLFVILLWHLITSLKLINPIFLSPPIDVLNEFIAFFKEGTIYQDVKVSANEFIVGFSLASFLGTILGFIFGYFRKVRATSNILVYALYSTPTIAILPLIVLWFGFGISAKVIIIFLASFFPILINVMDAVKNTNPNLLKLAKSYNASSLQTLKTIIIPNSMPNVITGIRIALPRGIIGMIVGEFYAGSEGLGYLISYYGATFQTEKLLAVVVLIIIISVSLTACVDVIDKKLKYSV